MDRNFICIVCPAGCTINANDSGGKLVISGNKCPRGKKYVEGELTSPERTVTAVVRTNSGELPFVPVRTDKPISKKLVNELLREIYSMQLAVPLQNGDVIIKDFKNTGVNVKITRTVGQ